MSQIKKNLKSSTFQFPYLETCRVRKQGRTKEKGGTAYEVSTYLVGRAVVKWLRHYATNWQVAGSIYDGVIEIFQRHNPSSRTMALGSTQLLTETSTR